MSNLAKSNDEIVAEALLALQDVGLQLATSLKVQAESLMVETMTALKDKAALLQEGTILSSAELIHILHTETMSNSSGPVEAPRIEIRGKHCSASPLSTLRTGKYRVLIIFTKED